jgi:RNA polymerase sigma-70 factor (ECF subfamily)
MLTTEILGRLRAGDPSAREMLIEHSCNRLEQMAHKMLKKFPRVRRWEETGDVLQKALISLNEALKSVTPESACHFYNFAAQHIRWRLLELAAKHQGPQGIGAKHSTDPSGKKVENRPGSEDEPSSAAEWAELLEFIDKLPAEDRNIYELLYIQNLTQQEAADVLDVSLTTVKRKWVVVRNTILERHKTTIL